MFIDSHCHLDRLDLAPYAQDFDRFVRETHAEQISHMLCVSIDLAHYGAMRRLVDGYDGISVSVGVHPNADTETPGLMETLVRLAEDAKVVAIGETGLDYYRSEGDSAWQQERFYAHIAAAKRAGKPLIIHTRQAREDTLRILAAEDAGMVGGVFHCFTEDWDTAKRALDLGFYISFSGIVTFNNAAQVREAARQVPAEHLLIETDAPYLAPVPFRGKANYPHHVVHVAQAIASLRGVHLQEVAETSSQNYWRLFGEKKVFNSSQPVL